MNHDYFTKFDLSDNLSGYVYEPHGVRPGTSMQAKMYGSQVSNSESQGSNPTADQTVSTRGRIDLNEIEQHIMITPKRKSSDKCDE